MISFKEKIAYGSGDFASNIIWKMTQYWLMFFYTDIYGLSPATVGTLFILTRFWDAVNDPIMGYFLDKTKSKHGKFRPYLLYGPIPLAICAVLCFNVPNSGYTGKVIYASVTYILLGMTYTVVNIPYSSLTALMTSEESERADLSKYRMIFGMVLAGLLVSLATKPFVAFFGGGAIAWTLTLSCFSLLSIVTFWFCFANVKERITSKQEVKINFKQAIQILSKNRNLKIISSAAFIMMIAYTIKSASASYFFKYNMQRDDLIGYYFFVTLTGSLIGMISSTHLIKSYGTKTVAISSGIISSIAYLIFYLSDYDMISTLFISSFISGVTGSIPLVCVWTMLAESVDFNERKCGNRMEGMTYSTFSFVLKAATGCGGALAGYILSWSDYKANSINQTSSALLGIGIEVSLLPAIASGISVWLLFYYSQNKNTLNKT